MRAKRPQVIAGILAVTLFIIEASLGFLLNLVSADLGNWYSEHLVLVLVITGVLIIVGIILSFASNRFSLTQENDVTKKKLTNTGQELERRVANAYRQMGARVEHDVELAGNQIDVYAELETAGGLLHRIAIEVKDWSRSVGIDIVNKFATVAGLLRGKGLIDEGIIVSASGFSKQARNAARTHGIRLLEPADLDVMIKEARVPGPILSTAPSTPTSTTSYAVHPQARTAQAASTASVGPTKDPAQAIPLSQQTEYQYDVFISYSHTDQEWVWSELLPRLERVGLKATIDYRDFEPGAPLLNEMERAVLESRKTVLVLTPAYLNSEWTELENILVQTMDPGARQRRLVPVLLRPCEIPLRIRSLVYVDLSHSQLYQVQFPRLLEAVAVGEEVVSLPSRPRESKLYGDIADDSNVPKEPRARTPSLDARVLQILFNYLQEHLGDHKMHLNELVAASGAERDDVIQCLFGLREREWLDYDLTVGAESGVVWLKPLGIRVAKDAHLN